jgi:hypothetical protein
MNEHVQKLNEMEKELESFPELLEELTDKFCQLNGVKDKDEFSRCIVFFLLGRLYEQTYVQGAKQ